MSEEKKIDLLDPVEKLNKKIKKLGKTALILTIFLILVFVGFTVKIYSSPKQGDAPSLNLVDEIKNFSFFNTINHLNLSSDVKLKGEDQDRINFLLLGMGGKGHDGAYLTDTIMVISIQPSTQKTAMISIPRDLYANIPGYGWNKINNAHAFGELQGENKGIDLIKQTIFDNLNLQIHYTLRVDFEGFITLIDELGGINVNVENSFDDYQYPILGMEDAPWNQRYQHLHFESGWQIMDGETALKYARSRHGTNAEGSDIARSKRQQNIIATVKEKVVSFNTLKNPKNIAKIISTLNEHCYTDLELWEMTRMYKLAKDIQKENIINLVIDDSPEGYLYGETLPNVGFIFKPNAGNFSQINYAIGNIFDQTMAQKLDPPEIEIQNGTSKSGLAYNTSLMLETLGFKIVKITNAKTQDYEKTLLYDLSQGKRPQDLEAIKNKIKAESTDVLPEGLESTADFVLIVGKDNIDKILAQN